VIRTHDLCLRRATLYPAELRALRCNSIPDRRTRGNGRRVEARRAQVERRDVGACVSMGERRHRRKTPAPVKAASCTLAAIAMRNRRFLFLPKAFNPAFLSTERGKETRGDRLIFTPRSSTKVQYIRPRKCNKWAACPPVGHPCSCHPYSR